MTVPPIDLASYLCGTWVHGKAPTTLVNPATETPIATASTAGLDLGAALTFARERGGPALRALTFRERGDLLRSMSRAIHARRDELLALAIANGGNTRSDAKFDVDGATATLAAYADLGQDLGDRRALVDGDGIQLGRSPRLFGQHVSVPRCGVAVHINAFNFPAWALGEKTACALLAGMPVLAKPATSTALLAHRFIEVIVDAKILPEGALSLLCGPAGDLVQHLSGQDVVAFTGSSATATALRALPVFTGASIRLNVEADSLNAAVLGPDVAEGSDLGLALRGRRRARHHPEGRPEVHGHSPRLRSGARLRVVRGRHRRAARGRSGGRPRSRGRRHGAGRDRATAPRRARWD